MCTEGEWKDNQPWAGYWRWPTEPKYKAVSWTVWKMATGCRKTKTATALKASSNKEKKHGPFVETDKDGNVIRKGTYKFGALQ